MEPALQAILDSLPKRRRSKLDPYAALIRGLRRRGRSYREIVTLLRERCGVTVAVHTLHHFVRVCAPQTTAPGRTRSQPVRQATSSALVRAPVSPADHEAAWTRIRALKQREGRPAAGAPKAFAYDENEPLQLITSVPPKRR
jgi:hypothetical protein